jgi:hypothetical protein
LKSFLNTENSGEKMNNILPIAGLCVAAALTSQAPGKRIPEVAAKMGTETECAEAERPMNQQRNRGDA